MLDEVQTGLGRTGSLFAFQQLGVVPDVMSLAKALGNGVPIGAMLTKGEAANTFAPGNHGTTFGGNPLACAAGLAVLDTLAAHPEYISGAISMGNKLKTDFASALNDCTGIKAIRGMGLMVGIQLDRPCPELVKMAMDKHQLLINVTRGDTIRLLPPLIMTNDQAEILVAGVSDIIREFLNTNA
jgi:acetylornithine aminotransferase